MQEGESKKEQVAFITSDYDSNIEGKSEVDRIVRNNKHLCNG